MPTRELANQNKNCFMGYRISDVSLQKLVELSFSAIKHSGKQLIFACANPHSLAVAERDSNFRKALLATDHLVADGFGLILIARAFNITLAPRVTGTEYFEAIMNCLESEHVLLGRKARVFFFGSSQKVLDLIAQNAIARYPNVEICGVLSPPFGDWSNELDQQMVETINSAKPDVLWVGMTAPKQEKWVDKNRTELSATVIGSIGAVFDFFAGTYPRAPEWACRLGLEWLVRLAKEPRRMWRRTFISVPRLIIAAIKYYTFGSKIKPDQVAQK